MAPGAEFWLGGLAGLAAGCVSWAGWRRIRWWQLRRRTVPPWGEERNQASRVLRDHTGEGLDPLKRNVHVAEANLIRSFRQALVPLEKLLGQLEEGVLVLDGAERIIFANQQACAMLDLPTTEPAGHRFWELVRSEVMERLVEEAMASGEPREGELEWLKTGKRWLKAQAVPLSRGASACVALVVKDLTEWRRLEQVQRDLVAKVSHELKTPLTTILAAAETLLEGARPDTGQTQRFLWQIVRNAERLHRLITQLLSLARIESSEARYRARPVEANKAIETVVEGFQAAAQARGIRFQREGAEEPLWVLAEEEGLSQILENLVDNALKYTPPGGSVTVRFWCRGDRLCVEVQDTGPGISEEDLAHIFERFYRGRSSQDSASAGSGLGLTIVKELVENYRGSIEVETALGQGSLFRVFLPRWIGACVETGGFDALGQR
jgi:two-component system phosphate regulon sensor histidine kinase PhoR